MNVNKTRYQRLKDFVAKTFFRNRKMNAEFADMIQRSVNNA